MATHTDVASSGLVAILHEIALLIAVFLAPLWPTHIAKANKHVRRHQEINTENNIAHTDLEELSLCHVPF
jgi:hypothetical protein